MGGVGWVACQGFLVRELVSMFWWVELDFFSLECNEVFSSSFEMFMGLVWLWAACILKHRAMFLSCWRIYVVGLPLELVASWVVLGFSVGMEAFDELLSINVPWSQEFSSVLRIWT